VLLPLHHGTESDFLDLPGEATHAPRDKTTKQSSEKTIQRNSLRGHDPKWPMSSNFSGGIQKICTNERTSPDPGGVNYAKPLKVTKIERF
jgi:hypothetical protein